MYFALDPSGAASHKKKKQNTLSPLFAASRLNECVSGPSAYLVHVQTEGRASCYCHEPGRVTRQVHAVTSRGDEFQSRVSLHALIERGRWQKEQSEDFSNFTGAKMQINI